MHSFFHSISILCVVSDALASSHLARDATHIAVTNNVFELTTVPYSPDAIPPSSRHLARQRSSLITRRNGRRQTSGAREDLLTIGGRLYITNATVAGKNFAFVIDTGSSDTWVISSDFQCQDPFYLTPIDNDYCGFGPYFDYMASPTFQPIKFDFGVTYTGGEFLQGRMGSDAFGIGGLSRGSKMAQIVVNQTIGIVNRGFWFGDGISSGLMGLGYPALARGVNSRKLNYTSVVFTLFKDPSIAPILTLALSRPTQQNPQAGGLIAFGGIPDIPYDGAFVTVPLQPAVGTIFAWYSIIIDGFDIRPPPQITKPKTTSTNIGQGKRNERRQLDYSNVQSNMLIDSGTSLVYLPDPIADYIASLFSPPARYNAISNMYITSCTATAPRVGVKIGGKSFFINEDDLMNRGPGAVGGPSIGAAKGQCAIAVQRAQGGSLVLGDTWMRNVLIVLDLAKGVDIGPGGSDKYGDGGGVVRIAARENY